MKKSKLFAVAACAVVLLSSARTGLAQFKLDHFKVYEVKSVKAEATIAFKGQFDKEPQKAALTELLFFANPVAKDRGEIIDKNAHFDWYRLQTERQPQRKVSVDNQFGKQELLLGQPRFLLVPTWKKEEGIERSERLDHFVAYEVLEGKPADRKVVLRDQFGAQDGVAVRLPRLFCVPVEKTHRDKTYKINNPVDHLTVYDIVSRDKPRSIKVADQILPAKTTQLDVVRGVWLCVPSKKSLSPPDDTNGDQLDHFRFYVTEPVKEQASIGMRGQFDRSTKDAGIVAITHFATPVSKNGGKILDKNAHLTFHRFSKPQDEPKRIVLFKNQFGEQKIITGRSLAILAPAEKLEEGSKFPAGLDHFKVYEVLEGEAVNKAVKLQDQFPPAREVRIGRPLMFCVPIIKLHDNKTTEIKNKDAHLTIYQTTATPDTGETRGVVDQFDKRKIRITRGVWLGVPTAKLDFKEAD